MCLDGQTFIGVKFDKAALNEVSFKGATLKNVSFHAAFTWTSWSKKYYRAIKTICFDGATMDKLTYAALKGWGPIYQRLLLYKEWKNMQNTGNSSERTAKVLQEASCSKGRRF